MSNDNVMQQQLDVLKAELAEAKQREDALEARLKELDEKAFTEKVEALEAEIQTKDETIASMSEAAVAFDTEKAELTETLTKAQEELEGLKSELDNIKSEAHKAARLAALKNAGFNEEAALEKLEKFAEASDELFDEIVALFSQADAEDEATEEEAETEAEVVETTEADEEADSDEAEADADAEVLETVEEETEASLTDAGDTDSAVEARTAASEWLSTNVLKSTAGIEK